ncbi:hypothetical protein VP01_988g2 [Puccinia sorghi]|uniref:Phosphatidate cytidylyltransferase n=1 Tax=Puccinia sorghi TaxID=27349 RepID=A0A0L6U5G9_9BASI|nr:hypothetical protein VP01_988g2 [Puccinia sorghi]
MVCALGGGSEAATHEHWYVYVHPFFFIWKKKLTISLGLGKALVVITAADLLRFRWPKFARFYQRCLGFLMRPSERNSWNGVIFYLLGVITNISVLSILILSWVDTAASVIGRRYGTEGTRLPSPPFARRKSIAGFMGAFGVGSMTALGFWWRWAGQGRLSRGERYSWGPLEAATALLPRQYRDSPPFTLHQHHAFHPLLLKLKLKLPTPNANLTISSLSIACGLVAAIAESFDCFGCDDNLLLPVLSGWGIWAIMLSFSY